MATRNYTVDKNGITASVRGTDQFRSYFLRLLPDGKIKSSGWYPISWDVDDGSYESADYEYFYENFDNFIKDKKIE